ncbi:MAG TPA: S46 family peptidase [Kofleriaceae bacterium]|nr:S46 family peptidase [Kofleriaceae bacterium]
MARQLCGFWPGLRLATALALVVGCGGGGGGKSGDGSARGDQAAGAPRGGRGGGRGGKPAPTYVSPGGMWMPSQMPGQTDVLQRLGIDMNPALLADPASSLLQSIVSLGGCSASFVSSEGLIITNHHCAKGALQYSSTSEQNLVDLGYLAKIRSDEKWNGPTSRVYVTEKAEDVTPAMTAGLDRIGDDARRHDEIEARQKKLVAECEGGRAHVRCRVASFFEGALWMRIQSLEIRDVRLVYAPPSGIGWFGGDQDNWMWPRHTGDFAFYRAYVGPDGVPADHSDRNVPYRSEHHLKVASKPLRQGDLVLVTGFPGATRRYRTAGELDDVVSWQYPRLIERNQALLAALREAGERDREAALKSQQMIFGLENSLKKTRGLMKGLVDGGVADRRRKAQAALAAWIDQDGQRKRKWGDTLARLGELEAEARATRDRDAALDDLRTARLVAAATTIVRMAEERARPDAERDPEYQQRNWPRIEASLVDLGRRYSRPIDQAVLRVVLERAARDLEHNRGWLERVVDRRALTAETAGKPGALRPAIDRAVARLYGGTRLDREAVRLSLLREASSAQLARSGDPLIRLAVALRPIHREIEDREDRQAGAAALVRPRYMAALREQQGGELAPDANGTLRIAFGTVRGYRARAGAGAVRPFTTLRELVGRHKGAAPFDVPDSLLAAAARDLGPYRDHKLDDVPVDFLSDADTTSGNSGSATLNARGELCGLLFDGTFDSVSADWMFVPDSQRSIHVDLRFVSWVMDAVDGADHILAEMGVTPSL